MKTHLDAYFQSAVRGVEHLRRRAERAEAECRELRQRLGLKDERDVTPGAASFDVVV